MSRAFASRSRGFTLVEVLIALTVSAMVAALAYQSLSAAADAAEQSRAVAEQVDNIDRVWQMLERDLRQARKEPETTGQTGVAASVVATGEDYPAFLGAGTEDDTQYNNQGFVLRFRRGGWQNPLDHERSQLQGVGYRLLEGKLYRFYWPILNSDPMEEELLSQQEDLQQPLLEGVTSVTLRFLPTGAKNLSQWVDQWPANNNANNNANPSLPLAVEMTLSVADFGTSRRIFLLAVEN